MVKNWQRHGRRIVGPVAVGTLLALGASPCTTASADVLPGGESDIQIVYIGGSSSTSTGSTTVTPVNPGTNQNWPTQQQPPQQQPPQQQPPQQQPPQQQPPQQQPPQQQPPQQQPPQQQLPANVTISIATVNGSGCPTGTAAVALSQDKKAFTVTYSQYTVESGVASERNCQLNMRVNVPGGYTYSVASVDYRGYAQLAGGTNGAVHGTYYFAGHSSSAYTTHNINGPKSGNWQYTDQVAYQSQVWHPCGEQRNLNANTRLTLSNASRSGSFISMDSTDVSFSTVYNLNWRSC
jgi:hypothetical protein